MRKIKKYIYRTCEADQEAKVEGLFQHHVDCLRSAQTSHSQKPRETLPLPPPK